jgi:NAD(P)-dependent dehydrogenase (short-subunit alcohol dehydrogenase family)
LAEDGAIVVVNYNSGADEAQAVVDEITSKGGQAIAIQADVGNFTDIGRLFESVIDRFAKTHILILPMPIRQGILGSRGFQ